jgi:5'-methylthioinosine phosphorylase
MAEVNRYKIEGCDLLGMTAMPEAVLARELGIDYALLALSANWAAGQFEGEILMGDISKVVEQSAEFLIGMLQILVEKYNDQ